MPRAPSSRDVQRQFKAGESVLFLACALCAKRNHPGNTCDRCIRDIEAALRRAMLKEEKRR